MTDSIRKKGSIKPGAEIMERIYDLQTRERRRTGKRLTQEQVVELALNALEATPARGVYTEGIAEGESTGNTKPYPGLHSRWHEALDEILAAKYQPFIRGLAANLECWSEVVRFATAVRAKPESYTDAEREYLARWTNPIEEIINAPEPPPGSGRGDKKLGIHHTGRRHTG